MKIHFRSYISSKTSLIEVFVEFWMLLRSKSWTKVYRTYWTYNVWIQKISVTWYIFVFLKHILLFSDFWTSYRFDRGMIGYGNTSTPNLHKSTSEPVNITQASHFPSSNLPIARIMPSSKSMQQFSNISESPNTCSPVSTLERSNPQSLDSIPESASSCEKNPVQFRTGNENLNKLAQSENSEMCSKCQARRRVDQTRSKREFNLRQEIQVKKSRSFERSMPNTHPRTPSKCNSNLYFTTSIELLNNSENQYFHSNLSDKMSDYEDIWKHSAAATPVPSVKMVRGKRLFTAAFSYFGSDITQCREVCRTCV